MNEKSNLNGDNIRDLCNWDRIRNIFAGMRQQQDVEPAEVAQLLRAAEERMAELPGEWHSFSHVTEIYYYEYFCGGGNYSTAPLPMHEMWRFFGDQLVRYGQAEDAGLAYERALQWNPVDSESYFALIEHRKREGDLERCRELTEECYDLCNTRALLARYYRNLGYYYLETYQPELAEALYQYSELFYPTETARRELEFLSKALKRPTPPKNRTRLRQILKEAWLPQGPSEEMVRLTKQAAVDSYRNGEREAAEECCLLLSDVTGDTRIWEHLGEH